MFGELVFLPCAMLVPLELAVGAANVLELTAFLALALAMPALLSTAGTQLGQLGFPSAAAAFTGGLQRGFGSLSAASAAPGQGAIGAANAIKTPITSGVGAAVRTAGGTAFPASLPILAGEALGRSGFHLVRHLKGLADSQASSVRAGPVRPKDGRP